MIATENFDIIIVQSQQELRDRLMIHYTSKKSWWLVTYKKCCDTVYISRSQVLDELLCFRWIDGIRRKRDDCTTMQLICARKTQSWSKTYKDRYEILLQSQQVHQSGRDSVALSQQLGLWDDMNDIDDCMIPDDFMVVLQQYPDALQSFLAMGASSQRFTLRWIKLAKTPSTRDKRIQQASFLASQGSKIPGL